MHTIVELNLQGLKMYLKWLHCALGAASKLNRRLTGGSARFWAVAIV